MDITKDIIFALKKIQDSTEFFDSSTIASTLSLSQVHCIAVIGDIKEANVTKISYELAMTTGAITKMCKKLLNENLVEKFQNARNNKEIYYRLTKSGRQVYEVHKQIHDKAYQDKKSLLDKYSEDEKAIILGFLNDIIAISGAL